MPMQALGITSWCMAIDTPHMRMQGPQLDILVLVLELIKSHHLLLHCLMCANMLATSAMVKTSDYSHIFWSSLLCGTHYDPVCLVDLVSSIISHCLTKCCRFSS